MGNETKEDRIATVVFTAYWRLVPYTGLILTPDIIDKVCEHVKQDISGEGSISWVFEALKNEENCT